MHRTVVWHTLQRTPIDVSFSSNYPCHSRSLFPSVHTSSNTYSNNPPPGIDNDLTSPSSSTMLSMALRNVVLRATKSFHWKPSCISGTRRNDTVKDREGCRDTRRNVGVCKCDVRGNAEKCRWDEAVVGGAFSNGATSVVDGTIPAGPEISR